jgi:hypothetical protein
MAKARRDRAEIRGGTRRRPAAQVRRRDGGPPQALKAAAHRQARRRDSSPGTSALLHQQADEGALRRRYRGAAGLSSPIRPTLEGMFAIYQKIFGLKFTEVSPPYVWAPGVQLYVVQDADTGAPMGAFYLDMFPREGKFNHFACFPQKAPAACWPTAATTCRSPRCSAISPRRPPTSPRCSSTNDVETLFHEFGHVMHGILSRSRFAAQTGFAVPKDFVEAPSQMLENWVWDKAVLDTFAADYRDPSKEDPRRDDRRPHVAARQATEGYATRRQLASGLLDLKIHTPCRGRGLAGRRGWLAVSNAVLKRVAHRPAAGHRVCRLFRAPRRLRRRLLRLPLGQGHGHRHGQRLQRPPGGFLDEKVGRRLRDEVYGVGHTPRRGRVGREIPRPPALAGAVPRLRRHQEVMSAPPPRPPRGGLVFSPSLAPVEAELCQFGPVPDGTGSRS